jgi:ribosomal protein L37AE/L43A
MFTEEELEDEEPEQRTYFCAFCKSKLDHLREGIDNTIWRCNECMTYYDTNIQDFPLKNISNSGVKTYSEFQYYPVFDEDAPDMIFMQGINPDEQSSIPKNVEILRDDNRVKHIQVKGSLVVAIAAMNEMDNVPL